MTLKMPRLTDTTLRDGSHAVGHNFSKQTIAAVVAALDSAGVPVIEASHGAGLGGSTMQHGFSSVDEMELFAVARDNAKQAKLAALLAPGIGNIRHMKAGRDAGLDIIRIVTHCTEADCSQQHMEAAKEMGLETVGFLMMSHTQPADVLAREALKMESYGCDCVYVVDSCGAMLPGEVTVKVKALQDVLTTAQVGFHAHNNLGVSIANSLAAIELGVDQIDTSLRGLGAGAGNTPTEVLLAVLNKMKVDTGIDMFACAEAAEKHVTDLYQVAIDEAALIMGYAGVYSSFLRHAKHVAEQYDVPSKDLLLELGRRQSVAGQEDWIISVAMDIRKQRGAADAA